MKRYDIVVENLYLELTRKCNLKCAHCMHGDSRNEEMSDKTIERIFEDVNEINCLEFAGGENSLAVDRLKKVIAEIKKNKTIVRQVNIYTNAVDISDEFIECLQELKEYCVAQNLKDIEEYDSEVYNNFYAGLIPNLSGYPLRVEVSLDKFHLESIDALHSRDKVKKNIEKLAKHFPVYVNKIASYMVNGEGRSKDINDIFVHKTKPMRYTGLYYTPDEEDKNSRGLCIIGPYLILSHDGKIIQLDKSYEWSDKYAIGNINEEKILAMFAKLQIRKKLKLCASYREYYKKQEELGRRVFLSKKKLDEFIAFWKEKGVQPNEIFSGEVSDYYELMTDTEIKEDQANRARVVWYN